MAEEQQQSRKIATGSSLRKIGSGIFLVAIIVPLINEKSQSKALKYFAIAGGAMMALSLLVED